MKYERKKEKVKERKERKVSFRENFFHAFQLKTCEILLCRYTLSLRLISIYLFDAITGSFAKNCEIVLTKKILQSNEPYPRLHARAPARTCSDIIYGANKSARVESN